MEVGRKLCRCWNAKTYIYKIVCKPLLFMLVLRCFICLELRLTCRWIYICPFVFYQFWCLSETFPTNLCLFKMQRLYIKGSLQTVVIYVSFMVFHLFRVGDYRRWIYICPFVFYQLWCLLQTFPTNLCIFYFSLSSIFICRTI